MSIQLPTIDLISIIEQRAPVRLKRVASTQGGEYAGNCPFCRAGTDRFHVWPHAEHPHYWCRHCNVKGDAIQFLKDLEGMSFMDACNELGIDPSDRGYTGTSSPLRQSPEPPVLWQETAQQFIAAAQKYLFSPGGKRYLDYLQGRGLTVETIKKKNIGCVPLGKDGRWTESPFERWGLNETNLTPEQFAKGCVRIPDGLFFPHYVNGSPWKLSMYRPFEPEKKYRRGFILGSSKECLLNEDLFTSGLPVVMTESFLDALSIEQEAGDLIVATSTDGSRSSRSLRCQARLGYAPYVLLSFDNDLAGEDASKWWGTHISNAVRWAPDPVDYVKDANDMLVKNADIRFWIKEGMELYAPKPALAIVSSPLPEVEEEPDPPLFCNFCKEELYAYTDEGTPCCEQHYEGRQAVEWKLREYVDATIEKPSVDPLTMFATAVDRIASIFCTDKKGCTITKDPPGYTLAQHVAFLTDKNEREQIAKEAYYRQLAADRRYKRLHPDEFVEE